MVLKPFSDDDDINQFFDEQSERFDNNVVRARELVRLSKRLAENEDIFSSTNNKEVVISDILRSAVVFLHATLEDFLRSVEIILLPYCDEAALNNIPLVGTNPVKPFLLGKLAAHREKSILNLIRESVAESLLKRTYNNTSDIAKLLESVGLSVDEARRWFNQLDALIKRRHQIVHRADRIQREEIEPITARQVDEWISTVNDFITNVIADVGEKWGVEPLNEDL